MKTSFQTAARGLAKPAFFLSFVLFLALSSHAHAHARLVKSTPAKSATLSKSPDQLDLWFNELLEEGFNTIDVFNSTELDAAKHTNLTTGKPTVDPADKTHLSVKLGTLPPGEYVVEWRVLSRDGHSAPGRIMFKIGAAK
ncbi:MAG: copper resistance CopC family protein [Chthoniobacteraceae bacterium]